MIRAGFRVDWEPYLKSVLLAMRAHLLGVRAAALYRPVHHARGRLAIPYDYASDRPAAQHVR